MVRDGISKLEQNKVCNIQESTWTTRCPSLDRFHHCSSSEKALLSWSTLGSLPPHFLTGTVILEEPAGKGKGATPSPSIPCLSLIDPDPPEAARRGALPKATNGHRQEASKHRMCDDGTTIELKMDPPIVDIRERVLGLLASHPDTLMGTPCLVQMMGVDQYNTHV